MSKLTIAAASRRLRRILRDLDHPPLGQAAALAEECGEVAEVLLNTHAYGKPLQREALGGELADVFVCLAEIAATHGIRLEQAIERKLEHLARKAPQWRRELAPALRAARRSGARAIRPRRRSAGAAGRDRRARGARRAARD